MATPHINAKDNDFAKTVLMPGDPLRAKFIAETFLTDPVQVNSVRGILGYTGTYKGKKVSVMASGMGCPSIGIYSHELFAFYGVENIIRVGSAGAITEKLKLRDIVAGIGSNTTSNYASQYHMPGTLAPTADYTLLSTAVESAKEMGIDMKVGNLLCSDAFYNEGGMAESIEWAKMGTMAVEMESTALYLEAARLGKRALAIVTISDHLVTGEVTTAEERQNTFTQMMEVALETAVKMDDK
ncbi:purine-nucleoside phosphorylase [Anaerotignum sp.]|nr:purine-nucleoside phosphorylase [Anaerotignum sp.]MBQ7757705.1 purine-nucleoside phosphorylase [Anaerotignum sp.]